MSKCESCRRGFNGRNGNGYMPCGCKKAEAKPVFVPPPPLIEIATTQNGSELKYMQPFYERNWLYFLFGFAIGLSTVKLVF